MTDARTAAIHLEYLRAHPPLVHNITNYVAMDVSANALLALGASPAMIHAREEVEDFVRIASALVLNVGTLSPPWVEAMHASARTATELQIPIVLDPVGAGATAYRTAVSTELAPHATVIRGNASEIRALAGAADGPTRGVDSTDPVEAAIEAARHLSERFDCAVAVTGPTDVVIDGARTLRVGGGSPLMGKVTALGCSASAAVAAALGACPAETDRAAAAAHALAWFAAAGARAGARSHGPGSFRVEFLDALHALDGLEIERGAGFA